MCTCLKKPVFQYWYSSTAGTLDETNSSEAEMLASKSQMQFCFEYINKTSKLKQQTHSWGFRSFSNGTIVNLTRSTICCHWLPLVAILSLILLTVYWQPVVGFSAYGNQWVSFATTVATICNRWQSLATISIDRLNFDFGTFI